MPRKSQFENLVAELINSAWWISPLVGLVVYAFLIHGPLSQIDAKSFPNRR